MIAAFVLSALMVSTPAIPTFKAKPAPHEDFDPNNCSLYCGACPELKVSGCLAKEGRVSYTRDNIDDGDRKSAWVVGKGIGQWFEFDFATGEDYRPIPRNNSTMGVDCLYIWNGYEKSPQLWKDHSRIREAELTVNGKLKAKVVFLNDSRPQRVSLPATLLRPNMKFRFTITKVYPGQKFDQTAVSEVRLDGFGVH